MLRYCLTNIRSYACPFQTLLTLNSIMASLSSENHVVLYSSIEATLPENT